MIEKNVVFAFDVHQVLLKPDYKTILKKLFGSFKKILILLSDIHFWHHMFNDGAVPEELVEAIDKRFGKYGITKKFLIDIINTQRLNSDMIQLLKKLKDKGYNLYIASNIWPALLAGLEKKFPVFQELFDGAFIPVKNNYIEKPDPRFFQGLKDYLNREGQGDKQIIFIDDKPKNIGAARKEGLISVRYMAVPQFIKQLQDLGISVD